MGLVTGQRRADMGKGVIKRQEEVPTSLMHGPVFFSKNTTNMNAALEKNSTHCDVETAVIIDGAEAGCDHDPATIYSNQYESF